MAIMHLIKVVAFSLIISAPVLALDPSAEEQREVTTFLDKLDNLWVDKQSYAEITMKVKTANYERELRLKSWSKGKDKALVRITHPPKEEGVSTLKIGKDIYNYVPKIARTTKITDALMGQSWMGSHLTNSDLVRASRLNEDYDAKLVDKKKSGSDEIWVIEANAKAKIVTLQRRIMITLNKKTKMPIDQIFFDKDGKTLRTITYHDIKAYGGKKIPSRIRVVPGLAEQKGEFTEVHYEKIDRKRPIADDFFNLTQLANP